MSKFSSFEPNKCFFDPNIPQILPHENMYKIQIGSTLFKISGASLSSDGPSYFTNFFTKLEGNSSDSASGSDDGPSTCQTILFIDRSAEIFQLIYQHLQGYYIDIKDEVQYTMLIADSLYYNLPRLRKILKESEYYYTKIGDVSFKLPKSLFERDGDKFNYFYITTDTLYVNVERVIISRKLIRPPPHSYSFVPRSPHLFKQIFQLLGGAKQTMDDNMRQSLINECRYYRLQNLEQQLIKCTLVDDPLANCHEIWIKLDDISRKGLSLSKSVNETEEGHSGDEPQQKKQKSDGIAAWSTIQYKRPYIDDTSRTLAVQFDGTDIRLSTDHSCIYVTGQTKVKFESTFKLFFEKNTGVSMNSSVREMNGIEALCFPYIASGSCPTLLNGKKVNLEEVSGSNILVHRSLWSIALTQNSLLFVPIKLDLLSTVYEVRSVQPFL
ncbi:hypothetical protein DAKH74_022060 [Maudiozyma humilis]|uniref:BTB domain-containing protein n=1 Tax=Maudiozyma humilis TaxID=51915 RepID=A0AAV5RVX3_MAUHU|nr:hypothetical protein DAKH74_022060 [Kazachstania humilis]